MFLYRKVMTRAFRFLIINLTEAVISLSKVSGVRDAAQWAVMAHGCRGPASQPSSSPSSQLRTMTGELGPGSAGPALRTLIAVVAPPEFVDEPVSPRFASITSAMPMPRATITKSAPNIHATVTVGDDGRGRSLSVAAAAEFRPSVKGSGCPPKGEVPNESPSVLFIPQFRSSLCTLPVLRRHR